MSALKPFRKRNRQRNPNLFQYGGTFPPPARCYVRENTDQVVCDFPVQSATQGANPMMTNPRRFTARANPTTGQSIALTTLSASQAGSTPLPTPMPGACFDPATGEVVTDTGIRYPVEVVEDMGSMVYAIDPADQTSEVYGNYFAKCAPGATLPANGQTFSARPVTPPPTPTPTSTDCCLATGDDGAMFLQCRTDDGTPYAYPVQVVSMSGGQALVRDPVTGMEMTVAACPDRSPRPSPVPPPTFRDRPMRPSEPPPSQPQPQPQPPMLRPTESSCGGMTQGMTAMFGSPVLPDFSGNSSSMLALTMIQPNLPQNVSGLQSPVEQAPMMGLGGGAAMMGPGGGFTQQMVLPTNVPMAPAATPRSGLSSPLQAQMAKKCSCEDCDCDKTAARNPCPAGTTPIIDPFTGKTNCIPNSRQPGSAFRFGSPTRSAAGTKCEGTLVIDPFTGKTTCYDRRPGSSFRFGSPTQQNPGGMESRRLALTNPMIAAPATVTTQNQEVGYGNSIRWL